jgi:hypothetical protein
LSTGTRFPQITTRPMADFCSGQSDKKGAHFVRLFLLGK